MSGSNLPEHASGSPFDALKRTDEQGEHWFARELQVIFGYSVWRDFANAVERAKVACANSGADPCSHFADARKINDQGYKAEDCRLTRYAAYLTAMNGDPRKPEIAAAQTYFAVKTREAEVAEALGDELDALEAATVRAARAIEIARAERTARMRAERDAEALAQSAAAWDHLASADGDWSVADAAKILSRDPNIRTGQNRLFTLLYEWGWIYRAGDRHWRANQAKAVDTHRLTVIPASHYHPRTGQLVQDPPQIRVLPKGLVEIHRKLGGSKPLAVQQQLEMQA